MRFESSGDRVVSTKEYVVMKTSMKISSSFALSLLAGLITALMTASVSQAYQLSIVGTGTSQAFGYSSPANGTADSSTAKMGYGGGFLIDSHMSRAVGFQWGVLYVDQKQDITTQSLTLERHQAQIPLTLQFHLLPGLTIGAGGYYAHTIGDDTATNDSTGAVANESDNYLQYKSYDMGAEGGVALHLPLSRSVHFLVDARYLQSFVNQDTSGTETTKPRGYQFMVGLTFGMPGMRTSY
jgi:basic membrane lipoprotein Med (substrate-binding protein (PBP1-ABC) superfamily)